MASSIAKTLTLDMGLKSVSLRPEMDIRLLDTEVREERPELTDDEGEDDRGVDTSELSELRGHAIGIVVKGEVKEEEEEEEEVRGEAEGACTDVAVAAAAAAMRADEEKYTEEAG